MSFCQKENNLHPRKKVRTDSTAHDFSVISNGKKNGTEADNHNEMRSLIKARIHDHVHHTKEDA